LNFIVTPYLSLFFISIKIHCRGANPSSFPKKWTTTKEKNRLLIAK
jgi:hypothetical protein